MAAKPADTEGWLYNAIYCKGLEHPWILVWGGGLEPTPLDTEGQLYLLSLVVYYQF